MPGPFPQINSSALLIGDNLDLLPMVLNNGGQGKIKCVYLDPPYNDGSQVFYDPSVASGLWLKDLSPRLTLLRKCLREDGILAISISDYELPRLRLLAEDIFGRDNLICTLIWLTKKGAQGIPRKNMIMPNHEYILIFAKNRQAFSFRGKRRPPEQFSNPDNDPRGPWKRQYLQRLGKNFSIKTIINPVNKMRFTFETPYTQEKLNRWIKEKRIVFPDNKHQYPMKKEFLAEYRHQQQLTTFLGLYPTKANTENLNRLFDGVKIFPYPKPTRLLMDIFDTILEEEDWVLDPYAGSGTTGEAVMRLNMERPGKRKFILIQKIEPIPPQSPAFQAGYRGVEEIITERIKRIETILGLTQKTIVHHNPK